MESALLDTNGLIAIGFYLLSLLAIGWTANRASKEDSLKDYYLAGSSLGPVALLFTLYATQYSGNTLFAVPGKAYRQGFIGLSVVLAVMAIVLVYFTFAPRLNKLAKQHRFISLGDFIRWRFNSKALLIAVNVIGIITLVTYALGNFKAVGLLLETASGGAVPFAYGILILAAVMAVYESLGGLRGVIWTDILQGSLLFFGCLLLFFAVAQLNGPESITNPAVFAEKLGVFFTEEIDWPSFLSILVLIAVGAAVYPQAIQRIYIARDDKALKRSYSLLFIMPLLTTLPMILVGISVSEWRPDLPSAESENVIIHAVEHITGAYPSLAWLMILYLGAAVAAIMSTIDSALLSLGSTITKDMIEPKVANLTERKLHRISRGISWSLMLLMALLAIGLPQTIWALLIFKFELLIQIAPAIILGARRQQLGARAVFSGLLAGCTVAIALKVVLDVSAPLGLHAGLWGLIANIAVLLATHNFTGERERNYQA